MSEGAAPGGAAPRVFTIPPGADFLGELAAALVDGRLIPGLDPRADPLAFSAVTLLLPTRRAARVLRGRLVAALGGAGAGIAAILPVIRPIGDIDEDLDAFDPDAGEAIGDAADALDLPPAIGEAERILGLARLIASWRDRVAPALTLTPSGAPIRLPSSPADAVHLARDLLRLIDQAVTEEVRWDKLATIVPAEHAAWWQMTLTFLEIATAAWPAYIAERGLIEPAERRRRIAERFAARLAGGHAHGPVIAAGSTGSIPTTARILAAVARLPAGAVVLPGLDRHLDDATFAAIAPEVGDEAAGHPQAALARLLRTIGIERADVLPLAAVPPRADLRERVVSAALCPAEATDGWAAFRHEAGADAIAAAFAGATLIAARTPAEEALAIAIALRETVETPGLTAALVTPDRDLARRVSIELARFGLAVEDSAGAPLDTAPPAVLARLAAETVFGGYAAATVAGGFAPETLLSLLKHPLTRLGLPIPAARQAARAVEIAALRGPRLQPGTAALVTALEAALVRFEDTEARIAPALRLIGPEGVRAGLDLTRRLAAALAPLEGAATGPALPVGRWMALHLAALRALAADEAGDDRALFAGHPGEAFAGFVVGFLDADAEESDGDANDDAGAGAGRAGLLVEPEQYPAVFAALLAGRPVRRPASGETRVFIWGTLEARLMHVDRMILGGLVEGQWPAATETGPWLSRPMRTALAFGAPERRVGLAAHDFAMRCGAADLIVTFPEKQGGAPTVPSRWLQRLFAVLGAGTVAGLRARGDRFLGLARRIDEAPPVPRARRAAGRPPLADRPNRINVTDVETWIRDPYALYARRILRLEPLEPLGRLPDIAARGSVIHDALADFAATWTGPFDDTAIAALIAIGEQKFAPLRLYPEVHALWWPRFREIARFVVDSFEASRPAGARRLPEVTGAYEFPVGAEPFLLTGRADRIDIDPDGSAVLIDFKTGTPPSQKQIGTLMRPQLPLEAAMLAAGAFEGLPPASASALLHVVLKGYAGRDKIEVFDGYRPKGEPAQDLATVVARAMQQLAGLVALYRNPEQPYLSRTRVLLGRQRDMPYDHLARTREWTTAGDEEEAE